MKNEKLIGILAFIAVFIVTAIISYNSFHATKTPVTNNVATSTTATSTTVVTSTSTPTTPTTTQTSSIKAFYIAIGDDGASGKKIGCSDSVIPVTRNVTPTASPLRSALETLLADKTQYYGGSGLYNSLYQSTLSIESLSIVNGTANIRLTGTYQLSGTCDTPRFKAQLEETAKQFATVKNTAIYLNNKPIDEALSSK